MQRIALSLTLVLFSVSARAHGPGTDFVVALIIGYALAPSVITVPIALLLPDRTKVARVGIGVGVSIAAAVGGVVAGALLPGKGAWPYFGVVLLAAARLAWYVVEKRSQASKRWPFHVARNFSVSCSRAILDAGKPIAVFARHDDGSWQFRDSEPTRPGDEPASVRLEEIYRLDPTIAEVADLAVGWHAKRSGPTMPWSRAKISD